MNSVQLFGNLTRDPELRYTQSGKAVVNIGIACNYSSKNASGEWVKSADYIDAEAWGSKAEVINKYFKKGKQIIVEGKLKSKQWEAQDGSKRSKLVVSINEINFPGDGKKQENQARRSETGSQETNEQGDQIPF